MKELFEEYKRKLQPRVSSKQVCPHSIQVTTSKGSKQVREELETQKQNKHMLSK